MYASIDACTGASPDDGGVGREHEVDAGVGNQVGLELGQVHVEGAVEAEGRGQRGDDLPTGTG